MKVLPSILVLEPSQKKVQPIRLDEWYEMNKTGNYELTATLQLYDYYIDGYCKKSWKGTLTSNTITIKIARGKVK